jgi:hypothetical protein
MAIDIKTLEYEVELISESGGRYLLTSALLGLEWEEHVSELAQRATVTVANMAIGSTYLMAVAKINCVILIYGKWGGAKTLVFQGTIWEWQYTSATQKELVIVAYDQLIRLQQSKDFKYFSAGMSTQALINEICGDWGISVSYKWRQSLTHEKKSFRAETVSDMIIGLLEEVRQKTGEKYIAYWKDGTLEITEYGTNPEVYKFDRDCTISTIDAININNLVTVVKIIGKEDDVGRAPVDDTVTGDTSYGTLQEIVRRDTDKAVGTAKAEAEALIKTRGKPEELIRAQVPDLPFTRKGHKVEFEAGNLLGFFHVTGVTHNGTTRQMSLTLERI